MFQRPAPDVSRPRVMFLTPAMMTAALLGWSPSLVAETDEQARYKAEANSGVEAEALSPLPWGTVQELKQETAVNCMAFHPQGDRLLMGTGGVIADEICKGSLQMIEVETGRVLLQVVTERTVLDCCFSPDGKCFLAGSSEGAVGLYETETGRMLGRTAAGEDPIQQTLSPLVFTPDGKSFAVGWTHGLLRVMDTRTAAVVWEKSMPGLVQKVAFTADGKFCIVGGEVDLEGEDVTAGEVPAAPLHVLDAATGEDIRSVAAYAGLLFDVSPSGHTVVMGSRTMQSKGRAQGQAAELVLMDVATGKRLRKLTRGASGSPVLSPDGTLVVARDDNGGAEVFSVETGRRISGFDFLGSGPAQLHFSPDGSVLVGAVEDTNGGHVLVTEARTGAVQQKLRNHKGGLEGVDDVCFNRDGRYLALRGGHVVRVLRVER